ncbi:MAG: L,D-transpeptidase family protein [Alphaproteobacteria bacterium]|nr:L,D-transpeptidase family protein [Alphaproteobacteria bacterium]
MRSVYTLVFAFFAVLAPMQARADEDPVAREIYALISGPIAGAHNLSPASVTMARRLYTERQGTPVWRADRRWWTAGIWQDKAVMAQNILANAGQEGLHPGDYAAGLRVLPPADATPRQVAEADMLLSVALLRYIADIRNGRRRPYEIDRELQIAPPLIDPLETLREGLNAPDFSAWLRGVAPSTPGYTQLRDALARMRTLAGSGAWPKLPDGPKLEVGQRDDAIVTLRRQLTLLGDLHAALPDNDQFDAALDLAVKAFQSRHGLDVDGVIGPATRRALNLPPAERVEQIILNMERLRWLDDNFGPRYVLVNIAGFELIAVNDNKVVIRSPVVVGREYRRTPIFSDRIINLILSPSWTPPPRLAKLDILPKVKANPAYLKQQGLRVFEGWKADARELNPDTINWDTVTENNLRFRFRQDPGPLNALGGVRFSLTNSYGIYLHDTSHRELFGKNSRAFSSGCIRVAKHMELALFALDNNANWPPARLAEAMISAKTQVVKLSSPLPVHIIYRTAWVDSAGMLQFRDDIYGRDALLRAGLKLDVQQ